MNETDAEIGPLNQRWSGQTRARYGWPAAYVACALLAAGGAWGVADYLDERSASAQTPAVVREVAPSEDPAEAVEETTQAPVEAPPVEGGVVAVVPEQEPSAGESEGLAPRMEEPVLDSEAGDVDGYLDPAASDTEPIDPVHIGEYRDPHDDRPEAATGEAHHVGEPLDPEATF